MWTMRSSSAGAVVAVRRAAAASASKHSSSSSNGITTYARMSAAVRATNRSSVAATAASAATSTMMTTRSFSDLLNYPVVSKSDFGEYLEYSVIHTNRSLNLMSDPFQRVMKDLNKLLKTTYNAEKVAIIPGSGTFGMEAVARQFATGEHVMVIRNGWFSFRWTELFDMGGDNSIPRSHTVLKAQPQKPSPGLMDSTNGNNQHVQYAPHDIEQVVRRIREERPAVLFAPHVETSTGMMLSDDYIKAATAAMREVGGLFVLDCIASGTVWVDMKELGVDVVISAPQKGWTGPACAALVMMSERAVARMPHTQETSFSMSLKRWTAIMDTYEKGGFGYHTTMPTDALRDFHEISVETIRFGIPQLKEGQIALGKAARDAMEARGLTSVAAPGFQAPGVLVYYSPTNTENPVIWNRFKQHGLQIAMGVPWRIDEPEGLKTFRIGLFGLDKIGNIETTVGIMEKALDAVLADCDDDVSAAA